MTTCPKCGSELSRANGPHECFPEIIPGYPPMPNRPTMPERPKDRHFQEADDYYLEQQMYDDWREEKNL